MANLTRIPQRLKSAAKNGFVTGAVDIIDDEKLKDQQTINQETDEHLDLHDTEIADRYTKEEVNNIVSRTPETDVIVIEVPAASQSDIAGWLDANTPSGTDPETGRSVRANKLYRVPGPTNTTFSEWAWNGTAYIMLANKDYGIDSDVIHDSDNMVKGGAIYDFVNAKALAPIYNSDDICKAVKRGELLFAEDYLVTPFIDVSHLDKVVYFGGIRNDTYHICFYDASKEFITDYWWSMGAIARTIDLERNTEAGARVRYARATMYIPNIDACILQDIEGNSLWKSNKTLYDDRDIKTSLYGEGSLGRRLSGGDIVEDSNYLITPYIDVHSLDGVIWNSCVFDSLAELCCFDINKNLISGLNYTASIVRLVDFEQNSNIYYIRATMPKQQLPNCYIKDLAGNILWAADSGNVREKFYTPFAVILQKDVTVNYDENSNCIITTDYNPNYSIGYIDYEQGLGEQYIYGDETHVRNNQLVYTLQNFQALVARSTNGTTKLLTVINYNEYRKEDALICYTAYGKIYGPVADIINIAKLQNINALYNSDDVGKALKRDSIVMAEDYLVTPYIDVSELNGVLYYGGIENHSYHLSCFTENYELVEDYWWSMGVTVRNLNFDRDTERGATIKYIRATIYIPNINAITLTDFEGNVLWKSILQLDEKVESLENSVATIYNTKDINKALSRDNIIGAANYLITPYIDVTNLDGVWYFGGIRNDRYHISCYDENKVFIEDYWWSMGAIKRYIDFERNTEKGATVKYVRATMYIPNIVNSLLEDDRGNSLWSSLIGTNSSGETQTVPSYYKGYLSEIEDKIAEMILGAGIRNDNFIFFTDTHCSANNKQSGKLIGELMRATNINKAIFGGDIIRAFGGRNEILDDAADFTKNWHQYIKPYGELYSVQGNHDLTIATSIEDVTVGYTFSSHAIRNYFMSRQAVAPELHYDENNPDSIYFYFDNKSQKIRYIFINTTDTADISRGFGVILGFHKPQSDWCFNAIAQAPSGYGIVVIGHIAAVSSTTTYVQALSDFLVGFKNKISVTVNSTTYDFSQVGANLLFMLAGHEHRDELSVFNNVPYITTCCDAAYRDYKEGQFGVADDYPLKVSGTIYEQTFDAVSIDIQNSIASFIRIGGGYDRIVHYDMRIVSVGNSINLTTSLSNAEWLSCNGTSNVYNGSAEIGSKYVNINTKVSVSNGVVTGIERGNAVVCARNRSSKQMELFYIEIL